MADLPYDDFDDYADDSCPNCGGEGERADLWTEIEVNVNDFRAALTALRLLTEEVEKLKEHKRKQAEDIMTLGQLVYADVDTTWKDRARLLTEEVEKLKTALTTTRDEWRIAVNQRAAAETEAASLRQKLEVAREAFRHISKAWPDSFAALRARAALTTLDQPHA
jgi:hypothetical protein